MTALRDLVADELSAPVDPRVTALAEAIAATHGAASRAVLFYGSCLREHRLEGLMLDFYLIVSDYRRAYNRRWLAVANRVIPPNVFYFERDGLVSKYAVLSEADFERECGPDAWTVSTAARFAQPSRLVWSSDAAARQAAIAAVSRAAPTLLGWTVPATATLDPLEIWNQAFALTFGAELRAERLGRSSTLIAKDPERYERFGHAALQEIGEPPRQEMATRWWRKMQRRGKWYSVARVAKASATFA